MYDTSVVTAGTFKNRGTLFKEVGVGGWRFS